MLWVMDTDWTGEDQFPTRVVEVYLLTTTSRTDLETTKPSI
jgi:hypothetical protein